jgi:hypothetical protein
VVGFVAFRESVGGYATGRGSFRAVLVKRPGVEDDADKVLPRCNDKRLKAKALYFVSWFTGLKAREPSEKRRQRLFSIL